MSDLEPIAITLAGPMGKLAWAGIKKCLVKYRKHREKIGTDPSGMGKELKRKGRIIGETYDRYANKLGAKFVQGDYKARRELYVINIYGDFRVVQNIISRMSDAEVTSEDQTRLFFEDLNRASDKVFQALHGLATRIDSIFDMDQVSHASMNRDHGLTNGSAVSLRGPGSSLSRALERSIPHTIIESGVKYCHGAMALQKVPTRSIEDIAIDGQPRMQYTYVCKFCFLQISNYQRLARTWGPYEWAMLAKSHVIACTTWLDSRALFKCIDCDKLGREHVTIDAENFLIHTQDHLQNATTGTILRDSAYFHEGLYQETIPLRFSQSDSMKRMEAEIAVYEKIVGVELSGDPVVQEAKATAVPLVEEDEDNSDIDKWYQALPEANIKNDFPRTPKVPLHPRRRSKSATKSLAPERERASAALEEDTVELASSPPPYQLNLQSTPTAATRQQVLVEKSTLTPVPTHLPERPKDPRPVEASFSEKALSDHSQVHYKSLPVTEKAAPTKDTKPVTPVQPPRTVEKVSIVPKNAAVTGYNDGLSECPGCGLRMETESVGNHLDTTCPSKTLDYVEPPQQYGFTGGQGQERENSRHSPSGYTVPRKPTKNIADADSVLSSRNAATTASLYGDHNPYHPSNQTSGLFPTQTQPSAPTHLPPPLPPQPVPRPKAIRTITPAQADENYRAQRHSGQTVGRPQTPSNGRKSRDLHVRQGSMPTASGDRIPQVPGGLPDWHNY